MAVMKATRTISGVAPVAVMTEPMGCPGHCVYCPTFPTTPRSYTVESPAVVRARHYGYEPRLQVSERLRVLQEMGHPTDKVELIIMGGTFLATPVLYQREFIQGCYEGLNGAGADSLAQAQAANEKAAHRCVGLCLETRPDYCGTEEIGRMLELGATRVELGVQTLDDDIYTLIKRGHSVAAVAQATRQLREAGFKVHYHWMPGLPGATPERDIAWFQQLFADARFRPDGLKLYPTLVVPGTELEQWYRRGEYQPYDDGTWIELLARLQSLIPKYVRVSRIMRDIPAKFIVAGCRYSNLGELVQQRMAQAGIECACIRCREYGHRLLKGREIGDPRLVRLDYEASGSREVFLSLEDERETLFGLLRLRLSGTGGDGLRALVRELHIYGPEVPLGRREEGAVQHRGLGARLLREAERIAREEFGAGELAILSGVGAREYYRNLGYRLGGHYMVRSLS